MKIPAPFIAAICCAISCFCTAPSFADEKAEPVAGAQERKSEFAAALDQAGATADKLLERALGLIGVRYKRGGSSVETGFDCSGFVVHVFREHLGFLLPRTSQEISREGAPVTRDELKPGDLVFFNTMRSAFSHVGIYLGDNRFVHAPRTGRSVRVEDMRETYWAKRYNGARRLPGT
jgi:cell wall-associated NlpC family hydrolase